MRCKNCGNKLEIKWNFCPRCGTERRHPKPIPEGACVAGLLIVFIFIVCVLFGGGKSDRELGAQSAPQLGTYDDEPATVPVMRGSGVTAAQLVPLNAIMDFLISGEAGDALRAFPPEFTGRKTNELMLIAALKLARNRLGGFDGISYEVIRMREIENDELRGLCAGLERLKIKDLPKRAREAMLSVYAENGAETKAFDVSIRLLLIGSEWYIDPAAPAELMSNEL